MDHASFVYFDNRLLGTVSPQTLYPSVYHNGIVALDFVNTASLTQQGEPDYDGLWTGIQPYKLLTGNFYGQERCFAFCYQGPGQNSIWEITKDYGPDNGISPIPCFMETKSFNFLNIQQAQNKYFGLSNVPNQKRLDDLEIWIDRLLGTVNFDIKYRPDQFPCWFDWKCFSQSAKDNNCNEEPLTAMECTIPVTFQDQYRPRLVLGQPPEAREIVLAKSARFGYEFQLRIAWTGQCRIRLARLYAKEKEENPYPLDYNAAQ